MQSVRAGAALSLLVTSAWAPGGSRAVDAEKRFHGGRWRVKLDFSSNINPVPPVSLVDEALKKCVEEKVHLRYPDYNYGALRETLAGFYGVDARSIIPCNGAAEALVLALAAFRPRRVLLVVPSYGEWEIRSAAVALGARVETVMMRRGAVSFSSPLDALGGECGRDDVIVLCNPHNPTGAVVGRDRLLDALGGLGCRVVVDEAYAELTPGYPVELPRDAPGNIVFVRSMTKWMGIPGLRLGFLYASDKSVLERIEMLRQPWNVNSLAECLALKLLVENKNELTGSIKEARSLIKREGPRLARMLGDIGLNVYSSSTCFLLVEKQGADFTVINEKLVREHGIAIRPCTGFTGLGKNYARIAVRRRLENQALVKCLAQALE